MKKSSKMLIPVKKIQQILKLHQVKAQQQLQNLIKSLSQPPKALFLATLPIKLEKVMNLTIMNKTTETREIKN